MSIGIQFGGKNDRIPVAVFLRTLESLMAVIQDVDSTVSGRSRGSARWDIVALSKNSPAQAEINGESRLKVGDFVCTIQEAVIGGMDTLGNRPERPDYFSYSALTNVKRMAIQARRLDFLTVYAGPRRVVVNQNVFNNIEYLIGSGSVSLGSIRGSLDSITVHSGHEFRVWVDNKRKPVACRFKKARMSEVLALVKHEVAVFGELRRNARGEPVYMVVEEFRPIECPARLPSIEDMSGLIEDLYGGMSLREHMDDLRND